MRPSCRNRTSDQTEMRVSPTHASPPDTRGCLDAADSPAPPGVSVRFRFRVAQMLLQSAGDVRLRRQAQCAASRRRRPSSSGVSSMVTGIARGLYAKRRRRAGAEQDGGF